MEIQFAALVAIDWADQEHVWAMEVAGQTKMQLGSFAHTPESVEAWASGLAEQFGNQFVAVAIEQSRGPLVFMLSKYSHLIIYPVHSSTLANYRKSFRPSGAKDDPLDARLLLDILARKMRFTIRGQRTRSANCSALVFSPCIQALIPLSK
jgi:hypothetical protein